MRGTRPPPCCDFSLTKFDEDHAVLFWGNQSGIESNDVYLLELGSMVSCAWWTHHLCDGKWRVCVTVCEEVGLWEREV